MPGEHHLAEAELACWSRVRPPVDEGRVELLVVRLPEEGRSRPEVVELAVGAPVGIPGGPADRWEPDPDCLCQITAMEAETARHIANGQPLALFGDNLLLDLALDAENLPPRSTVRIGTALLEVTPEPHTGCKKYAARFGIAALAWISAPERRHLRLRGVHLRVVEPGRVRVGDVAAVIRRGGGE